MFIAKLYCVVYIAFGVGLLINTKFYKKLFKAMYDNETFIFSWGIFATVVGFLIVLNHNTWESSWVVLVTITGWIALIKGLSMLIFPGFIGFSKKWFDKKGFLMFISLFAIVFGGVMGYFGFFS